MGSADSGDDLGVKRSLLLSCLAAGSLPLAATVAQDLALTDVTLAAGITWQHNDGATMMGACGAFLDYDKDGRLDLLLGGGFSQTTLYRNVGGGRFAEVTPPPFPAPDGWETMCLTVADFDDDGDPDVFVGRYGPNRLFRNDGVGPGGTPTFTDITTGALAGTDFTTTAAFGDYDGDGNLDLFVGNYIGPRGSYPNHQPTPDHLFRGHGDGTFTDVTDPGLAGQGTALASAFTDFDQDGDVDLWVCNDFGATVEPNRLHRNDGPNPVGGWSFAQIANTAGTDLAMFCMGIASGDYDHDGDLDRYFTNLGRNVLLRDDGGVFADVTATAGVELTHDPDTTPQLLATSWGCGFHDFDHDGWVDLYVSNGHIPAAPAIANGRNTRNTLYRHDGASLTFTETGGRLDDGIGRGAAFGDFDNDGDVDVLQVNIDRRPVLLRNDSPRRGQWFAPRLIGRLSHRDAIGAFARAEVATFTAVREVRRNDSFESSSEPRLHFGLGQTDRVRAFDVRWPSGIEQQLYDLPVDGRLDLVEPVVTVEGLAVQRQATASGETIRSSATLVNHDSRSVAVVWIPDVRAGDATTRPGIPAGTRVWSGRLSLAILQPGERRPISFTENVGPGPHAVPDLACVFTVWDGYAIDQARAAVPGS